MKRPSAARVLRLTLAVALAVVPVAGLACPQCNEAIAELKDGGALARGFAASEYLLIAMPFLLIGFFGRLIWRAARKGSKGVSLGTQASRW